MDKAFFMFLIFTFKRKIKNTQYSVFNSYTKEMPLTYYSISLSLKCGYYTSSSATLKRIYSKILNI